MAKNNRSKSVSIDEWEQRQIAKKSGLQRAPDYRSLNDYQDSPGRPDNESGIYDPDNEDALAENDYQTEGDENYERDGLPFTDYHAKQLVDLYQAAKAIGIPVAPPIQRQAQLAFNNAGFPNARKAWTDMFIHERARLLSKADLNNLNVLERDKFMAMINAKAAHNAFDFLKQVHIPLMKDKLKNHPNAAAIHKTIKKFAECHGKIPSLCDIEYLTVKHSGSAPNAKSSKADYNSFETYVEGGSRKAQMTESLTDEERKIFKSLGLDDNTVLKYRQKFGKGGSMSR